MTIILAHTGGVEEHGESLANGLLWGVSSEQVPGLIAALLVPVGIWLFLAMARSSAGIGRRWAVRFTQGFEQAALPVRAATFLMLVSAAIHLALVPHHATEDPATAWLFALEAVLLAVLCYRAYVGRRWRFLAGLTLAASVLVYLGYLLADVEEPDELGIATKLAELVAFGLIVHQPRAAVRRLRRLRRVGAVGAYFSLILLTGIVPWGVTLHAQDEAGNDPDGQHQMVGMAMWPAIWTEPTAAQQAAADRLVNETRLAIAKYADPAAAVAAGFTPEAAEGPAVHYSNSHNQHDGVTLDPNNPEGLVYAITDRGTLLLGAVYSLPDFGDVPPDAGGGSLTSWHAHTNACISLAGLVGFLSPFGACPAFSINVAFGPMMHVWIVNLPGGPFGLEPEMEDVEPLLT